MKPSYQVVVQTCHFAVACALAQLAVTCGLSAWWGLGWTLVLALAKEFGFDTYWPVAWGGEHDSLADSAIDFSFYGLGLLVSITVFYFSGRL